MTVAGAGPVLEIRDLRKQFGGQEVLRGVDSTVGRGEVRAIIGPNGAGKTTLINVLTGVHKASSGTILFDGTDVTRLAAFRIARRGMARTYQIASLFSELTVVDNVRLACNAARHFSTIGDADEPGVARRRHLDRSLLDIAYDSPALVGLTQLANRRAAEISHGDQRLLEVAVAIASNPMILLLDEPTAGMSPAETHRFIELVNDKLLGRCTLVIVEHDMNVVMNTADVISVLAMGTVLAEVAPEAIKGNASVQEAYLGSAYA